MDKQTGKLIARIAENLPDMGSEVMQGWIENPKGLQKFLAGLNPPATSVEPVPVTSTESALDFIVRVDRSVKPTYPGWVEKLIHPELELAGPTEYDLSMVGLWLYDDQKTGAVLGSVIYYYLNRTYNIATCLNLQDGLAIQQKGIAVFRKLFSGKTVFLWGSVVQGHGHCLLVPYLCEFGDNVMVDWCRMTDYWLSGSPALRFTQHSVSVL